MEDHDARRNREIYQKCWETALNKLFGWPSARTRLWARRHGLDKLELAWLRHETAMYFIVPLLVPNSLQVPGRLQGETLVQFQARLVHALNFGDIPQRFALMDLGGPPSPGWMESHIAKRKLAIQLGLWLDQTQPELYNWEAGKARIGAILAEYGEMIPTHAQEAGHSA